RLERRRGQGDGDRRAGCRSAGDPAPGRPMARSGARRTDAGISMTASNRKLTEAARSIARRGLAALVIYSDGTCNILRASYLRYFAEVATVGPNSAAIVSADGRVALLVQPE